MRLREKDESNSHQLLRVFRYQDIFLPLFVLNCEKRRKGAPFMSERESVDSERMSWLKMSAPIEVDWAPRMNGS